MKALGGCTLATLAAVLAYLTHCVVRPQKDCRCCNGKGIHRSKWFPRLSRRCWWCRGRGRPDRFATRLWKRHRARKAAR